MQRGWLKLWRKSKDSPAFKDGLWRVWCYCLIEADHEEQVIEVHGGKEMKLPPGSFTTGRHRLGRNLGLPSTTAMDRLKKLEKLKMLTLQSVTKFTVVTICNWASYQTDEPESRHKPSSQSPSQRPSHSKNLRTKEEYSPEFEAVWNAMPFKRGPKKKAFKAYKVRLKGGRTHQEILKAAQNYATRCRAEGTEERYTMHCATFVGPDEPFSEYLKSASVAVGNVIEHEGKKYERLPDGRLELISG